VLFPEAFSELVIQLLCSESCRSKYLFFMASLAHLFFLFFYPCVPLSNIWLSTSPRNCSIVSNLPAIDLQGVCSNRNYHFSSRNFLFRSLNDVKSLKMVHHFVVHIVQLDETNHWVVDFRGTILDPFLSE
jgi:hypothetical protein